MSAWNPTDLDKMVLEPCHLSLQLYVSENKYLDGKLYMRSNDLFLGAPWNIAGYSLLIYMFAHLSGYKPRKLYYTIGDSHIYSNHINQVQEQITRNIRLFPKLVIKKQHNSFDDFTIDSFELLDYNPHPFIKANMAV
jgi:thymidylate synthase